MIKIFHNYLNQFFQGASPDPFHKLHSARKQESNKKFHIIILLFNIRSEKAQSDWLAFQNTNSESQMTVSNYTDRKISASHNFYFILLKAPGLETKSSQIKSSRRFLGNPDYNKTYAVQYRSKYANCCHFRSSAA